MFTDASGFGYVEAFRVLGAPYGTRTRVTAVKGRCPGPLDEGRIGGRGGGATYTFVAARNQAFDPARASAHRAGGRDAFGRPNLAGHGFPDIGRSRAPGRGRVTRPDRGRFPRLPLPGIRHRLPGLRGGQRVALLQELDGLPVGRAHERHYAVARRAVDGDAGLHHAVAHGVDVVDLEGEMAEMAGVAVVLSVPVPGELEQRRVAAVALAIVDQALIFRS